MIRAVTSLFAAVAIAATPSPARAGQDQAGTDTDAAGETEAAADSGPRQTSRMEVRIEVLPSGRLRFHEEIHLELHAEEPPALTLQKWVRTVSGPPLLRQRLEDVRVTDGAGNPLEFRRRAYADWRNIDFMELPADPASAIHVDYEVARALRVTDDRAELVWDLLALSWNLPVAELRVELILPEPVANEEVRVAAELYFEAYKAGTLEVDGNRIRWRTNGEIAPDQELVWTVSFPRRGIQAEGGLARDYWELGGLPLKLFFLLLSLVPILWFVPPRAAIVFTRLYNLQALAAAALVFAPQLWYWIAETTYRDGGLDNTVSSLVGDLSLLAFVAFFVFRQDRWLAAGRREAYFLQFGLPVVLALPLPMYSVNETIVFLPLIGFPVALYWLRGAIAVQFGAGTSAIVERVATEGEIPFAALARGARLSEKQLVRVLEQVPNLPVVADFERRMAYSPTTAALQKDLLICPNCGGATQTKGAEMLACGYCQREFTASRNAKPRKPVPVLVEAFAKASELLGTALMYWSMVFALVFLVLEFMSKETDLMGVALLIAIILGIGLGLARLFYGLGARFREGKAYGFLRFALLVGTPFVVPLLAYRKLGSKRVKLHFDVFDRKEIEKAVAERGELSFAQLAELLETSLDEAVEVARYLAGNDLVDAVFDRVGRRLVARKLYADMAREGSCTHCGGILGVIRGQVACHHCGTAATGVS